MATLLHQHVILITQIGKRLEAGKSFFQTADIRKCKRILEGNRIEGRKKEGLRLAYEAELELTGNIDQTIRGVRPMRDG